MNKGNIKILLTGLILGLVLGVIAGILLMSGIARRNSALSEKTEKAGNRIEEATADITEEETEPPQDPKELRQEETELPQEETELPEWTADTVYYGGDKVIFQNRIYRAKWWTQGETPGQADVWEDTQESPVMADTEETAKKELEPENKTSIQKVTAPDGFKVVGYYPSWKPGETAKISYEVVTHVIYAFAIPTAEGGLRPLENPETAKAIIADAHKAGRKVLLAVGGWSYQDVPLEATFVSATETEKKRADFVKAIVAMCEEYGFDGIDMDWEHPRVDGPSAGQYEAVMLALAEELHQRDKVLTSAVLSGATPDGNIYYDAAAHSDKVLGAVDWIHVMAYDGGDGERHSSYDFAVRSAEYWRDTRGLPAEKVVLGMPFYARPGWAAYSDILAADQDAWQRDTAQYNGMEVWYNGVDTIQKKTRYALDNLGGVMVWALTQDTANQKKSLLQAIGETIRE